MTITTSRDLPGINLLKCVVILGVISILVLTVGGASGCPISVPNPGSNQTYQTVSAPHWLMQGIHVICPAYSTGIKVIKWFWVGSRTTTTIPTTAPTSTPTTVRTPTPAQTTNVGTLSSSPSVAELQARLDTAKSTGTARRAAMQAAYRAWAIPSRPDLVAIATNARTTTGGLKVDGTDNTAALQALINRLPSGATLYFPPGTYRINGPITITKPLTLFGQEGTIFNCQRATGTVFTITGATLSSKMSGITVTGIVIEGPGIGSMPLMMKADNLQNAHFSYVKFHNVGYAALRLVGCADAQVEDCVFDNVYRRGDGYGVLVSEYSDGITVRDSFFVTKGRHGIATGGDPTPAESYARRIVFENNYLENMTGDAIDGHPWTAGPYIVRGNVVVNSHRGVSIENGIVDISDNVFIDCYSGIMLRNQYVDPTNLGSKVDRVVGNILINTESGGMTIYRTNVLIQDNVAHGLGGGGGFGVYEAYTADICTITGNVLENFSPAYFCDAPLSVRELSNNWIKSGGVFMRW